MSAVERPDPDDAPASTPTESSTAETWTCDRCAEPLLPSQMRYTGADDIEARTGRHARCQPTMADLRERTERAISEARAAIGALHSLTRPL